MINLWNSFRATPSTGTDSTDVDEEGSTRLIECTGKGQTGNGCVSWVPTWFLKKIPKGFINRSFLCGFCAAAEVADLQPKQKTLNSLWSVENWGVYLMQTQTNSEGTMYEQLGYMRKKNEDVYQTVINVAKKTRSQVSRADISICHRVPT